MFIKQNSFSPFVEARVLTVDIKRSVCKCRTTDGHLLTNVRWGFSLGNSDENGETRHPLPDEIVCIALVSGEPVIFMSMGVMHTQDSVLKATINRQRNTSRFYGNYNPSMISDPLRRDTSTPEDTIPGDRIISNDSGAIYGLLRGGTFIAKATALAQLIISRMDDLVRIVSRNYEMFSDAMAHYSVNLRGQVYNYFEYFRTPQASRMESPDYYEVYGNVEVGDEARSDYLNADVSGVETTTLVKMQRIPSKTGLGDVDGTRWVSTYSLEGKRLETSSDAAVVNYTRITTDNQEWKLEVVTGGVSTFIDIAPHLVHIKTDAGPEVILDGTTNTATLNATTVNVNATDTTVTSTNTTVQSTTTNINATTATVTANNIGLIGTVTITGAVTVGGGSGIVVSGGDITVDSSRTIRIGTLDLKTHRHTTGDPGYPTGTPY